MEEVVEGEGDGADGGDVLGGFVELCPLVEMDAVDLIVGHGLGEFVGFGFVGEAEMGNVHSLLRGGGEDIDWVVHFSGHDLASSPSKSTRTGPVRSLSGIDV